MIKLDLYPKSLILDHPTKWAMQGTPDNSRSIKLKAMEQALLQVSSTEPRAVTLGTKQLYIRLKEMFIRTWL